MKILAIGAHSDDVEIGCGGTLLKWKDQGHDIVILTITDSEYTIPTNCFTRTVEVAKAEAEEAAKIIGADLICLDKPTLQLIHNEEFSYEFDEVINKVKPNIVLTHWGGDIHSDHIAVSLSSIRASRHVERILLYRSNWYFTETHFKTNYIVDISQYIEKKLEVIKVYKSVLEPVNYSWIDFIKAQNTYEGRLINKGAAEGFNCIKYVD